MRTYHLTIEKQQGTGRNRRAVRIERDIRARDIHSARRKVGALESRGAQSITLRGEPR